MVKEKKTRIQLMVVISSLVIALAIALYCILYMSGGYVVKFTGQTDGSLSFELGGEADIPEAYVVNRHGIKQLQKVTYRITSAQGETTETKYPVAICDSVGTWNVECVAEKVDGSYNFEVVDTVAPEIVVGTLPSDVFVGEDKEYSVPAVNFLDSSPIDYENSKIELFFEGEKVEYNEFTNAFIPETWGQYTLEITASDIYGNVSTETCTWRAKDLKWKDANLKDGYLASYDHAGYLNLVSSGYINSQWDGDFTEEYLEEYKGETGVVKLTMNFNSHKKTAAKIQLAKYITPEELGDKKIVIRYMLDTGNVTEDLCLAGNYVESMESSASIHYSFTTGEWSTAVVSASDLKRAFYVDDDGVLRTFQLGFSKNGTGTTTDLYIAYVSVADTLDAPQNFVAQDGVLSWDAVEGAEGYTVYADDEVITLKASQRSLKMGNKKVFKVVACGDDLFTLDSTEAVYVNDTLDEGYIAEFDEAYYKYLVWNNGDVTRGGIRSYACKTFACEYDKSVDALRLDMTHGRVAAGVVVKFPKAVKKTDIDNLVLRVWIDKNVKLIRIFQYGGEGRMLDTSDLKPGWNTLVIKNTQLVVDAGGSGGTLSGLQIMFFGYENPNADTYGTKLGQEIKAYLGSITNAKTLDTPQNVALNGQTLTWDAVEHANRYLVVEDGKETTVTSPSYTISGGDFIEIYALGDDLFYAKSNMAYYVNDTLPDGYLATFAKSYYRYLVTNNGVDAEGGMKNYESASFKAQFNEQNSVVDVNVKYSWNAAGMVVKFPKVEKADLTQDIIVNLKLDENVKGVRFYAYGNSNLLYATTDVKAGWNSFVIPRANVSKAVGNNPLKGMQIVLYNNDEFGHAYKYDTTMTASISIGAIKKAQPLETPENFVLTGTTLTWDAVANASGYLVVENDKETIVQQPSCVISGAKFIEVYALGDNHSYTKSDRGYYINDPLPEGYLATFDEDYYEYLVWNNGATAEGGMKNYDAASFKAQFNEQEQVMDVSMKYSWLVAGMVVKFPEIKQADLTKDVIVKLKLDENVKAIRFYAFGSTAKFFETTDITVGWNTFVIPKSSVKAAIGTGVFKGMQIILYNNTDYGFASDHPEVTGAPNISIGSITLATQLDAPQNIVKDGNTLTWDAVANASGYLVVEDGQETVVQTATYEVKGGDFIEIYALGDDKFYTQSSMSYYINDSLPEGYLATFDKEYYEYLVWNNGENAEGGMKNYGSSTFKATFNEEDEVMDIKAKYTWHAAGMVVKFPNAEPADLTKNVIVNIKLDENVKGIRFYAYGSESKIYETTEVKEGWNRFVIPKENVKAAINTGVFKGMQIILYNNTSYGFASNYPDVTGVPNISIGEICYEGAGYQNVTVSGLADGSTTTKLNLQLTEFSQITDGTIIKPVLDTDGIFYNGEKLDNVNLTVTDSTDIVSFEIDKTPAKGDKLIVKGQFENKMAKLFIGEYTMYYTGSAWTVAEARSVASIHSSTSSKKLFLNLNSTVGASRYVRYKPLTNEDGIFYNGTRISDAYLETQQPTSIVYYGLTNDPATGDTLTIKGKFAAGKVCVDVASYTVVWNGSKWIQSISASVIWLNPSSNTSGVYIKLGKVIGTAYYVPYTPLTELDGIFYNGERVTDAKMELQAGCQTFYLKLSKAPSTGDTIKFTGKFVRSNLCVDIATYTIRWNGSKWVKN